jgi:hypothetical protein
MFLAQRDDGYVAEATNSDAMGSGTWRLLSSVLERDVEALGRWREAQAAAWKTAIGPHLRN